MVCSIDGSAAISSYPLNTIRFAKKETSTLVETNSRNCKNKNTENGDVLDDSAEGIHPEFIVLLVVR